MSSTTPPPSEPGTLSEDERAKVFAQAIAGAKEGGAPRLGQARIPPKAVLFVALTFLILGVGGSFLEHYYGGAGATTSTTVGPPVTIPPTPQPPTGPVITVSTRTLMSLKRLTNTPAPPINLTDQSGHPWSLATVRGKVVVLTFFNGDCSDLCPVIGAEIHRAESDLGAAAASVEFVVVNTDPNALAVSSQPAALVVTGLDALPNVTYLTGPLATINTVWSAYGVSIRAGGPAQPTLHNDVMYFIDPKGHQRVFAIPFGNENSHGGYYLEPATINQFASGIASTAISLAK